MSVSSLKQNLICNCNVDLNDEEVLISKKKLKRRKAIEELIDTEETYTCYENEWTQ